MGRIDYSGRAADFRAARTLPPDVAERWTIAVRALDLSVRGPVLDLGAGTGGFLDLLAEWCIDHPDDVPSPGTLRLLVFRRG